MEHQFNEMSNVRLPRTCKRTKQYTAQQQNVRQTRRTRAAMQHDMIQQQQTAMYGAPPQMPDYSAYSMPDQRNLQPNNGLHSNIPLPRTTATYTPTSMTDQRNLQSNHGLHPNNGMHPNIQLPRTTATYTPTSMTEQSMGPRYMTRRMVHTLTTGNALNVERYWHPSLSPRPPVSPLYRSVQQIQTPVACPTLQNKDVSTQTDIVITDKELKLLKGLREEKVDMEKFCSIIEKSDYIVTFSDNENKNEEEQNDEKTSSNDIVKSNAVQQRNDVITMAYVIDLQRRLASSMSSANSLPAIEYNSNQTDINNPASEPMQESSLPSAFLQNEQQQDTENEQILSEEISMQNVNCDNNESLPNPENIRPTQSQVPPPGFPIPNLMNQCMYNNQMRYGPSNHNGYCPPFRPHQDMNSINFFQAAAFFGQYYVQQIHHPRPHRWCQNPNMLPPRPPWL